MTGLIFNWFLGDVEYYKLLIPDWNFINLYFDQFIYREGILIE